MTLMLFRSTNCQAKKTLRTIDDIIISKRKDLINIRVEGKSFMHNQVRIIVGTLINVGINKLSEICVKKFCLRKIEMMLVPLPLPRVIS